MKGKGAQFNPENPFSRLSHGVVHQEGIDEFIIEEKPQVEVFYENTKKVISKNSSSDLSFAYSVNPYQGCEHGCTYCYARNSHTYWGFSAGLDFESKLIVKREVASHLEKELCSPNWKPQPIMLSGNTDCYQPIERKYELTRAILEVALKYQNPVSLITKNTLIQRDLDLLIELAKRSLVHVYFSITTLDEELRGKLEPRTATAKKKLEVMRTFSDAGVPVGVMNAPIIPGLNHQETPDILKISSEAGACAAGYTVVRLNGQLNVIFEDWLKRFYPDRTDKVISQIKEFHGGKLNDTQQVRRMKGEGNHAQIINQLFQQAKKKYFGDKKMPSLRTDLFRKGGNYNLFE